MLSTVEAILRKKKYQYVLALPRAYGGGNYKIKKKFLCCEWAHVKVYEPGKKTHGLTFR